MTTDFSAYTLRTLAITQHQWVALTSTTMSTDSLDAITAARSENLKTLHTMLTKRPPIEVRMSWVDPYSDMQVGVYDTLVKHDLMSGAVLEERELAMYTLPYYAMNSEEN